MVWENDTKLIVMLCPLVSASKEESSKYWYVDHPGDTKIMEKVGLELRIEAVKQVTSGLTKRKIILRTYSKEEDMVPIVEKKVVHL